MELKKYFLPVTAGVTVTLYHIEQAKEVSEAWGRMNVASSRIMRRCLNPFCAVP